MTRKGDIARAAIAILAVCLFMAFTSGCIEEPQAQPQWGNGNPPASWTETFGNDNGARMDYVQMELFSRMDKRIKVLEDFCRIRTNGADPNESR